ncbi:MAG: polysaccharide deacetylase [Lachnospiraceae bacterium]|nr:polysaccharide deacetylase [Lachnospiraceae bacterium]
MKRRLVRVATALVFIIVLVLAVVFVRTISRRGSIRSAAERESLAAQISAEETALLEKQALMAEAAEIAKGYDYDGAIAHLMSADSFDLDNDILNEIGRYTSIKATLQPVDPLLVPHIFYHSLIVDPERAFDTYLWDDETIAGTNAWMTTVPEFDAITRQMYDNGWVFVRLKDLVVEKRDAMGNVTFSPNDSLLLPQGKKAVVLSIDDWSYYHTYDGKGYADKAVVDELGRVKCQYTDKQGNVSIGDYDVVPRLNTFLTLHPDGAYKGARGMIAMTGYNGVMGYRTDAAYDTGENIDWEQVDYLAQHPDFDYQKEVEEAKKVAQAVKDSGWEFACHTWGHLSVTGLGVETLSADQERWQKTVANIVGKTDIIIFAHGADIGNWRPYDAETNPVYAYFKSMGYNYYCNVDASTQHWVQINKDNVRQGRIDCDGLQMYRAREGLGKINPFEGMFDVASVFDPVRPTPVTATGKE